MARVHPSIGDTGGICDVAGTAQADDEKLQIAVEDQSQDLANQALDEA